MSTGNIIAFCGTRGVPANYGGFETAVDEISRRFVRQGLPCEVFCRNGNSTAPLIEHEGRRLTYVSGARMQKLDTVMSAIQTGWHLWKHRRQYRHVFWFNSANLPGILITLLARIPMSVNTDGLEWRRAKWSLPFKLYSLFASFCVARLCRTLISDSEAIHTFYRKHFRKQTTVIPYGVPPHISVSPIRRASVLERLGLEQQRYFLQVTRFEPDNLPLTVAQTFAASCLSESGFKLVLVGYKHGTPYADAVKGFDGYNGVSVLDAIYDPEILAVLRENCFAYVHGNSVGGTNPALLEAMAFCPRVLAIDSEFSHEVLGDTAQYFTPDNLGRMLKHVLSSPDMTSALRSRVHGRYQWDAVAGAYMRLANGQPTQYRPVIDEAATTVTSTKSTLG